MWSLATEVDDNRQSAAAVLRLGGTARAIAREIDPLEIAQGRIEDIGDGQMMQLSGLTILLRALSREFAPLDIEVTLAAIHEFQNLRRMPGEGTDSLLSRFDVLWHRARNAPGFGMGVSTLAWTLLTAMHIPPNMWIQMLAPFGGNLPIDENKLNQLRGLIRRTGICWNKAP